MGTNASKNSFNNKEKKKGCVYLIGAGPGDPELITIKATKALQKADVVFYDYLANDALLNHCPKKTQKIYVGKRGFTQSHGQEEINRKMKESAQNGKTVVRLKGGDPFIFGRGGEEAMYLEKHKVPFELVPGVSSAHAVPLYAGIPITHRDHTSEVVFVTGHKQAYSKLHWQALAQIPTIVFLMGTAQLKENMKALTQHGKSKKTPVAIISRGSYALQKTHITTIENLIDSKTEISFKPPCVIVVGSVVNFHEKLNWFEEKK